MVGPNLTDQFHPKTDDPLFQTGMNTSTVPVYVSETSRSAVRGRSLAIHMSIVIVRHP